MLKKAILEKNPAHFQKAYTASVMSPVFTTSKNHAKFFAIRVNTTDKCCNLFLQIGIFRIYINQSTNHWGHDL